ncbi:Crp/Fnr family transcriptional regulator [Paenibacillus sp. A14]|uniref:Crp/Fnr family transcriptional regulator n=1 Tax=Paenibacillus sp. A14 TaxID=3119820 RepID=UPI002FE2C197
MNKLKYLSRVNLFQILEPQDYNQVERDTRIEPVEKGSLVAAPNPEEPRLYFVKSGAVRLYSMTLEGKELTLDVLTAGHLFGEIGAPVSSRQVYAVTLEDSVICTMSYGQFKALLREKPDLAIKFIEIMSARLAEVEELLEHMAYSSVRKRLLFLLNKLADKFAAPLAGEEAEADRPEWVRLEVELTHQELASMMGSTRETVTEAMNRLAAEGIVKRAGQRKPLWIRADRVRAFLAD